MERPQWHSTTVSPVLLVGDSKDIVETKRVAEPKKVVG